MTANATLTALQARAAGFTCELFGSSDCVELELLVKPDTDLDGTFVAYDLAEGELLKVNGWLFTFEDAAEPAPMPETIRGVHLMAFTAEGRGAGTFTAATRADWRRIDREARERAGKLGTVLIFSASVRPFTGKLVSVSPLPTARRA